MLQTALSEVELICSKCRELIRNKLTQFPLRLREVFRKKENFILDGFLSCTNPKCNAQYPILDGTPIIVKSFQQWWESQFGNIDQVRAPEDFLLFKKRFDDTDSTFLGVLIN